MRRHSGAELQVNAPAARQVFGDWAPAPGQPPQPPQRPREELQDLPGIAPPSAAAAASSTQQQGVQQQQVVYLIDRPGAGQVSAGCRLLPCQQADRCPLQTRSRPPPPPACFRPHARRASWLASRACLWTTLMPSRWTCWRRISTHSEVRPCSCMCLPVRALRCSHGRCC